MAQRDLRLRQLVVEDRGDEIDMASNGAVGQGLHGGEQDFEALLAVEEFAAGGLHVHREGGGAQADGFVGRVASQPVGALQRFGVARFQGHRLGPEQAQLVAKQGIRWRRRGLGGA